MKEMVGGCCVCADDNGWTDNPLIYCDGEDCEVAVHQGCYGIQEVPDGNWYCAKCTTARTMMAGQINEATFCCQLCPFDYGALKRTDRNGWAHVICALYIPEVRFGNVHSMEPVILTDVPVDKFQKTCYICAEERPNDSKKGACMSCNKTTCKRSFHVTCAQRKGLLCEEGGVSKNVKYCGYCENHLKKAINDPAIKVIPACPAPVRASQSTTSNKKKTPSTVLLTPPPPPPPPLPPSSSSEPMLADPIRPATPPSVASVANSIHSVKLEDTKVFSPGFSPPLTTSSRSSVALEHSTPPLPKSGPLVITMANGNAETTVGTHCLQQLQIQSAAAAAAAAASGGGTDLNGYPGPSQLSSFMHEIPARNTTSVASLLPPGAHEYHLNGSGDEEKTVKAVLTAPLTKAKRIRDAKGDLVDKTAKRPRANARPPAPLGSANSTNSSSTTSSGTAVGKSASMQRLMNLVQPVVSEVVTDFQRDRVAERRAAVAQTLPSTSNGAPEVTTPPLQNGSTTEQPTTATINGTTPPPPPTLSNGAPTTSNQRLNLPSFMEQLLERQWDQGSSLLMANAHFDVAQLLSCLFQLKSENVRLEDNLATLRKRRDYLFALNTRLSEVNCIDVVKQREPVVPKQEIHKPEPTVLPANHSSQLFEDVKPPAKQTKKATVVTTPATPVVQQNHRTTTPSTTAVAPPITPANLTAAVSAANDIAASLSPDRMPNGAATQAALIRLYGSMSHMDPAVAAQFSMMSNFPGGVNQAIFSRLLATAQPAAAMANIASMMNGGMPTAASVATSSPSSTTIPSIPTPNGK